jgi:hypothetical protein
VANSQLLSWGAFNDAGTNRWAHVCKATMTSRFAQGEQIAENVWHFLTQEPCLPNLERQARTDRRTQKLILKVLWIRVGDNLRDNVEILGCGNPTTHNAAIALRLHLV